MSSLFSDLSIEMNVVFSKQDKISELVSNEYRKCYITVIPWVCFPGWTSESRQFSLKLINLTPGEKPTDKNDVVLEDKWVTICLLFWTHHGSPFHPRIPPPRVYSRCNIPNMELSIALCAVINFCSFFLGGCLHFAYNIVCVKHHWQNGAIQMIGSKTLV